MKMITRAVLLLSVCLAGASEERRPGFEVYTLRGVEEPLSAADIQSAFNVLGLKIERFACTVPEESKLRISLRQYIHGAEDRALGERTIPVYPGAQRFILFTHEADDALTFTFQARGQRVSWARISLEGYPARAWGRVNGGTLEKGRAVPFYLFAANLNGIESFSPDRSVEELTGKYALAVVFFAEWL
jgi:hypothetical protein